MLLAVSTSWGSFKVMYTAPLKSFGVSFEFWVDERRV